MYYVYIIYNNDHDKFYIGQTNNINKRIIEHNSGVSKYTSKYSGKWMMKYTESFDNRTDAIKRERFLKNKKIKLVIEN
ncbi:MAG: GIY-YIG nuclease family protein [Patescibacteria group bacterium]